MPDRSAGHDRKAYAIGQLAADDAKGRTAVLDTLSKTVTDQVLTDDQRAAMQS